MYGGRYSVEAMNFPDAVETQDILHAILVKKINRKHYFLYDNVGLHSKEKAAKMKEYMRQELRKNKNEQKDPAKPR